MSTFEIKMDKRLAERKLKEGCNVHVKGNYYEISNASIAAVKLAFDVDAFEIYNERDGQYYNIAD